MAIVYPSLIAANPLKLAQEITTLDPYCQGYHLDIMDYHFVPSLALDANTINAIAKVTNRKLWVHLMISEPINFLEQLFLPAQSMVIFHFESTDKDRRCAKRLREKKLSPGIAVNPKTPIENVFRFLNDDIDHVLIMSVEPGFSGQDFLPEVTAKIAPLIAYRDSAKLKFRICMDGGISKNNIHELSKKGVDDFGVGSAIFGAADKVVALQELQKLAGEKIG